MRSQRFFKDIPARSMKAGQVLFLMVPIIWGLVDAGKGDSENALIKLLWFTLMLGSYATGYMLGDSNKKECGQQHFKTKCDLPHFPEGAKFSRNQLPVEVSENSNMGRFLKEKNQEMALEYKREMDVHKMKENEPGLIDGDEAEFEGVEFRK